MNICLNPSVTTSFATFDLVPILCENQLCLPNGKTLTLEKFIDSSLFKHTPENKEIFLKLKAMSVKLAPLFEMYHLFIRYLRQENWDRITLSRPDDAALLSILAYFNEDINLEELMIIQTAAEAKKINTKKELYSLEKIEIHTIENLESYLKEIRLPPYEATMMLNRESSPDLKIAREWKDRSLVEKTVVEYRVMRGRSSVDVALHEKNSRFACKNVTESAITFCLLSPLLILKLAQAISSVNKTAPEDHCFMFGHNPKFGSPLYNGLRVISIGSPLTKISSVHNFSEGPLKLSIQYHDYYHIFIDYNNPYVSLFCKLATHLNPIRTPQPTLSTIDTKISTAAAQIFVDREAPYFRYNADLPSIFWLATNELLGQVHLNSTNPDDRFYHAWTEDQFETWTQKIYYPTLFNTVFESARELLYPAAPLRTFNLKGRKVDPNEIVQRAFNSTGNK